MFNGLRGNVIEIDDMADGVHEREEEGRQGADLVKLNVGVQRDVLLNGKLLQLGQEVPGHGQQQQTVAEGERGGRSSGDGDAHAHDVAQIRVFGHERVVDEAVDEQGDGDDVEDEEVEDVLTVLFQEGRQLVPAAQPRVPVALLHGVDVETRHSRHVGRSVQKVLLGALAVQSDGDEITCFNQLSNSI